MKNSITKVCKNLALAGCLVAGLATSSVAVDVNKVHFLIPGGAGGGWDGTERGVGEALKKSGLVVTSPPKQPGITNGGEVNSFADASPVIGL